MVRVPYREQIRQALQLTAGNRVNGSADDEEYFRGWARPQPDSAFLDGIVSCRRRSRATAPARKARARQEPLEEREQLGEIGLVVERQRARGDRLEEERGAPPQGIRIPASRQEEHHDNQDDDDAEDDLERGRHRDHRLDEISATPRITIPITSSIM